MAKKTDKKPEAARGGEPVQAKPVASPPTVELRGSEVERRVMPASKVELRTSAEGVRTLDGYGAVFNQETVIGGGLWGFRERIAPGAFTESLKADDVRALFNHDANQVLGRNTTGTLRLKEDGVGLHYEVDLNTDDPQAVSVGAKVARGDVSQSSFAFAVPEEGEQWDFSDVKNGMMPLRTIVRATLYDVSPVTYPAYPQTSVSARSKSEEGRGSAAGDYFDRDSTLPESTRAAVKAMHQSAVAFHAAVRSLQEQIDISDASDYGDPGAGDPTGTGSDDGDTGGGSDANAAVFAVELRGTAKPKLTPGAAHAVRALRRTADGARHAAVVVRACMRDATEGDNVEDLGSDVGANAADLLTLEHHSLELSLLEMQ